MANKTTKVSRKRAPGGGVKAADGAITTQSRIGLDAESEQIFLQLGNGNKSLGAREAARRVKEHKDLKPFNEVRHSARGKS